MSLLAEPEDTRIIYYSLTHTSEHLKANALELLENIIEQPKLKKEVLQLIDVDFSSRLRRGLSLLLKPLYGAETKPAFSLESALSGEDLWFFLSGIYIIKVYELEAYYSQLRLLASSDQPLLLRDIAAAVFP